MSEKYYVSERDYTLVANLTRLRTVQRLLAETYTGRDRGVSAVEWAAVVKKVDGWVEAVEELLGLDPTD